MAKDAELERLKTAQDLAFSRKQAAQATQEAAWKRRKAAGDVMHAAYEEKDRAYHAQENAWQDLQRQRDSKGPRIGQLNSLQEAAYQNMKSAYDSASSAYDRHDGAGAKSYAELGRGYKAESQGYVDERRRLVAELRAAADHQRSYAPTFQAAKGRFDTAKREYDAAKAAHERTQTEFKTTKEAFDKASKAFKARLDIVKAQNAKRANDKRSIAQKAGVPYAYLDKCYVNTSSNGTVNIYFGGVGEPNGPGHGHYTMDRNGKVTYRREPFDPHGTRNFVRDANVEHELGAIALNVFQRERSAIGPRTTQYSEGGVTVKVKSGFNRRTNTVATDVILIDRTANPDEHFHLILSEHDGSILFSEWRKNH